MQLIYLVLFLALIPTITTLQCYQCNSLEDAACADAEGDNLAKFAQNCPQPSSADLYCRKIVQIVNKEKSIVRSCGLKKGTKDCYKTAGVNHASVCSCQGDLCNSAPSSNRQQQWMTIVSSIMVVAVSMIFVR
ncbi:unnamed protein product [Adineta ricciae]|uniref:Protein sleepless n=1 Tax=Adineta ricciae TaxID=249248 RepID=A0A813X403_ADIRI|nr:unnamed protein product [Adineta ricciae]